MYDLYFQSCTSIGVLCWVCFILPLVMAIPTLFLHLISPLIFYWWFFSPQLFHLGCLRWLIFFLLRFVWLLFSPLEVSQDANAFQLCLFYLVRLCFVSGVRYLLRFLFMDCIVLGVSYPWLLHPLLIPGVGSFGPHTWFYFLTCWIFSLSHFPLVGVVQCLSFMFMYFTIPIGFRWLSWCSLTRPPSIAIVPLPRPGFPSGCSSLFST